MTKPCKNCLSVHVSIALIYILLLPGSNFTCGKEVKMSFKAPQLTEEENHSRRVPASLLCDACKVITYQLKNRFKEKYINRKLKPTESEAIDLIENVCKQGTFESYGVKDVDGVSRLTGPGAPKKDSPGLVQGGGLWPQRLSTMCNEFFNDVEEKDVYQLIKDGQLGNELCFNKASDLLSNCIKAKIPKDEL